MLHTKKTNTDNRHLFYMSTTNYYDVAKRSNYFNTYFKR